MNTNYATLISGHNTTDRPAKELKGFKRIFLKAGENKTVSISISAHDLAYWNEEGHQWKVNPGKYLIGTGSSSQDIWQQIVARYWTSNV